MTPANDPPARVSLDTLETRLATMTDAEVRRACIDAELESPESDLLAGECERRNIDL